MLPLWICIQIHYQWNIFFRLIYVMCNTSKNYNLHHLHYPCLHQTLTVHYQTSSSKLHSWQPDRCSQNMPCDFKLTLGVSVSFHGNNRWWSHVHFYRFISWVWWRLIAALAVQSIVYMCMLLCDSGETKLY